MAAKLYRNSAIAIKIETTSGTDSVPTPAANALVVRNMSISPIAMTVESRDLMRAYLGNSEDIVVARWFEFEFEVEMAGSGTAGTAPAYDAVMRLCGHSKTVNAGTSVVYAPISSAFETASIYCNIDQLLHKSTWCMAKLGWDLSAGKIPVWKVSGKGLDWQWVVGANTTDPGCPGARQLPFVSGFAPPRRACTGARVATVTRASTSWCRSSTASRASR